MHKLLVEDVPFHLKFSGKLTVSGESFVAAGLSGVEPSSHFVYNMTTVC